jgi:hypothetical protein
VFIAEGNGIDMKTPVKRRGDKDPVEAFFFRAKETIDSPYGGHAALSEDLDTINSFSRTCQKKAQLDLWAVATCFPLTRHCFTDRIPGDHKIHRRSSTMPLGRKPEGPREFENP